jgi:DNA (cytosine-5)-methyltransferase 1
VVQEVLKTLPAARRGAGSKRKTNMQLILSLFPGIGLLDRAFELEGFCVVRGPDVIWGGDIRNFHPPAGKFSGVIGGPPCQMFSRLAHMVRHNGHEPKFGNLIPEYERCVREAAPQWFLMEEVVDAPRPVVEGYEVWPTRLNNRQCFDEAGNPADQNRLRAISFGFRGRRVVLPIETAAMHSTNFEYAACGGTHGESGLSRESRGVGSPEAVARALARKRGVPIAIGGSGKPKPATRRLNDCVGDNIKSKSSFANLCRLQGLPEDFLADSPLTVSGKCKAVGNGVPLPMGRAIAKAIKEVISQSESE